MKALKKLEIIHEDEHIVVINKPAGILSVPDRFDVTIPNIQAHLAHIYGKIYVVHRIDKDTSGVLLFAKTEAAHKHYSLAFQEREVEKYYLAIINGHLTPTEGLIDHPIAESLTQRGKYVIHRAGKESRTSYFVQSTWGQYSLVEVQIHTGRTHQIRVHLNHIGHPLLVDHLYGNRTEFFLSEIKGRKYNKSRHEEERPLLHRQPLHASRLVVPSMEDTRQTFEADLPKDMRAVINQMEKWAK